MYSSSYVYTPEQHHVGLRDFYLLHKYCTTKTIHFAKPNNDDAYCLCVGIHVRACVRVTIFDFFIYIHYLMLF